MVDTGKLLQSWLDIVDCSTCSTSTSSSTPVREAACVSGVHGRPRAAADALLALCASAYSMLQGSWHPAAWKPPACLPAKWQGKPAKWQAKPVWAPASQPAGRLAGKGGGAAPEKADGHTMRNEAHGEDALVNVRQRQVGNMPVPCSAA